MTPSYGRTQEQHDNLQKLINGLKALPDDYGLLNMYRFASYDTAAKNATPEHPCRTSMCIAGHGPSLGIPFIDVDNGRWTPYSKRAFGFINCVHWDFCFSAHWPDDMNQAIARLEMAQRGDIPKPWDFDDIYPNTFTETEQ